MIRDILLAYCRELQIRLKCRGHTCFLTEPYAPQAGHHILYKLWIAPCSAILQVNDFVGLSRRFRRAYTANHML